jgi:hypothetical protein
MRVVQSAQAQPNVLSLPMIQNEISVESQLTDRSVNITNAVNFVQSAFSKVSGLSSFESVLQSSSASVFSLSAPINLATDTIAKASFTFISIDGDLQTQKSWTVLPNGSVVASTLDAELSTTPVATSYSSHNWVGYEIHNSSGITGVQAIFTVPTVSSAPAGTLVSGTVHETALTDWVGMSASAGGGGGLIQTGFNYLIGTTSSTDIPTWYEDYGCGCAINDQTLYTSGDCYGNTYTKTGDSFNPDVALLTGDAIYSWYDSTTGSLCTASYSTSESPSYGQLIAEAPAYSGEISQIAKFSTTTFTSGTYQDLAGHWQPISDPIGAGNYNTYTLTQYPSKTDASPSYSSGDVTVTWANCDYNYTYVNG